ncbi:hypothetical protein [Chryseolinea lacunae]|uniref:Translocation/assembly module TamB n=1 Tax=Chryseolinea lacunae TaxID=2801331 RepID=A0ABS1KMM2_9BACT|nr:hypothetical protein [Chryseolinea lacunae]MBL0740686.1 hypothetical protein [Chryseolinea lacunae]
MRLFLKRLAWALACVVLLCVIAATTGLYLLTRYGIAYDRASFRFPSTLYVRGLSVHQASLTVKADTVEANWSWGALLHGNIHGNFLTIANATADVRASSQSGDSLATLPGMVFDRVRLKNIAISLRSDSNFSRLLLGDVRLAGLRFQDSLSIDSLINKASRFDGQYVHGNSQAGAGEKTFLLSSLPRFAIRYAKFDDCGIAIDYGGKPYVVSNLSLLFGGANTPEQVDVSLRELQFRYQDSLDVHFASDRVTVNGQDDAAINNLSLVLPGLQVATSKVAIAHRDGSVEVGTVFKPSYFNTNLLLFFFPSWKSMLPSDTRVDFQGGASYHHGRLMFSDAALTPDRYGSFVGNGFVGIGGLRDSIDLKVTSLYTSSRKLAGWFGMTRATAEKECALRGTVHVAGRYDRLHATGQVWVDRTAVRYSSSITQTKQGMHVRATLHSPQLSVSDFATGLNSDLKLAGASVVTNTDFAKGKLSSLTLQLRSDSMLLNNAWFVAPHAAARYTPKMTTLALQSQPVQLELELAGNVMRQAEMDFRGKVDYSVSLSARSSPTGIHSIFRGTYSPVENRRALAIQLDTLRMTGADSHDAFVTTGSFALAEQPGQMLTTRLALENVLWFDALLHRDALSWDWKSAWMGHRPTTFPQARAQLSVTADSTLIWELTGQRGKLAIEKAVIESTAENVHADFVIRGAEWAGYAGQDLAGNIDYSSGHLDSHVTALSLTTPFTLIDSADLSVDTRRDSVFAVGLRASLPELEQRLNVSATLSVLSDGYTLAFGGMDLQFGGTRWNTQQSSFLQVNRALDSFSGNLVVANKQQRIRVEGSNNELRMNVDSLDIHPLATALSPDVPLSGVLNAQAVCNIREQRYTWSGTVMHAQIDTVMLGDLHIEGENSRELLQAKALLTQRAGRCVATLQRTLAQPLAFDLLLEQIDLHQLTSLLPWHASDLHVSGVVNGRVAGTYDSTWHAGGFVVFPDTEVRLPRYDLHFKTKNDSVRVKDGRVMLNHFTLLDEHDHAVTLEGGVNLDAGTLDLAVKSDRFRLLDETQERAVVRGVVDVACDVRVSGSGGQYSVSGRVATLHGAAVTYLYKNQVSLDDREREIEFVEFGKEKTEAHVVPRSRRRSTPVAWNVELDVGTIDATILFSEAEQEHIKTTAQGKLFFKTGNSAMPFAYGGIESNAGNILYHTPMISDLRFTIERAAVRWAGELNRPLITFSGSEVFRLAPSEISSLWTNTSDRWPIAVVATINDQPLDDLTLTLDLTSTNNQVADWIRSQPADSRQANALALMIRGRINTSGASEVNPLMESLVTKMNEIASRNIKGADVSFYDDSRVATDGNGPTNRLGYMMSRGILNKKIKLSMGGNVDLTGGNSSLSNIKVEYVLREDPTVTLQSSRASVYTGVIDGMVDESSVGVTYVRRFRNFLSRYRKPKKP